MNDGIDVVSFRGHYQVQKADRRRSVRHDTFGDAERAAAQLIAANPEDTFVISQEVARVTRWRASETSQ